VSIFDHSVSLVVVCFLGLIFGSFLNVVIYRLPLYIEKKTDQSLIKFLSFPASSCPHCKSPISWFDNIPLLSWLHLKGRCRSCKKNISYQYPLVECMSAAIFFYTYLRFHLSLDFMVWALFFSILLALFFIDLKTYYLPMQLTISLIFLGIISANLGILKINLIHSLISLTIGYLILFIINYLFKLARHKDGLGGGDFLLYGGLGAWFGSMSLVPILLMASLLGLIFALIARLKGKDIALSDQIAFGPFLILSSILIYIHQYEYYFWVLKLYGL
jgi:leader peptidase (prepilin peptidase)/N-methyltransferase